MEIFSRHQTEAPSRRHRILHCILHATLQLATLASVIITLNEVEKLHKSVKLLEHRKK